MSHQLQTGRTESSDRRWLVALIDVMEQIARPECDDFRCDPRVVAAVRAQLACPALAYPHLGSAFSLRN